MSKDVPTQGDKHEELLHAFMVFDRDRSGHISKDELKQVMKSLGEKLSDAEIDEMMAQADEDKSGTIDCE
jgi:calmodulin